MRINYFFKAIFLILFIGFINNSFVNAQENKLYTKADKGPYYIGGKPALEKFLKTNLKYPDEALTAKKTGVVEVSFIIETSGAITNIQISQGIGYGCDEEAKRLIRKMPKWLPGSVGGKTVRILQKISIKFPLDENDVK